MNGNRRAPLHELEHPVRATRLGEEPAHLRHDGADVQTGFIPFEAEFMLSACMATGHGDPFPDRNILASLATDRVDPIDIRRRLTL
jgi:hypothetical protein